MPNLIEPPASPGSPSSPLFGGNAHNGASAVDNPARLHAKT